MKIIILALSILTCIQTNHALAGKLNCGGYDWETVGYKTATAGNNVRSYDVMKSKCKQAPTAEARGQYLDGYTRAAIDFCTKQNGYAWGSENKKFPEVCPFEIRRDFVVGYNLGVIDYKDKMAKFHKRRDDQEQAMMGSGNDSLEPALLK